MEEYEEHMHACPHCGFFESEDAVDANVLIPKTVVAGRYEIGVPLYKNNYGITYSAWDRDTAQRVALREFFLVDFSLREPGTQKIIPRQNADLGRLEVARQSFTVEMQKLTNFSSCDYIERIYRVVSDFSTSYAVIEYPTGETLQDRIRNGRKMKYKQAATVFLSMLRGLQLVHNEGIVHKDIGPDCVRLCDDGRIVLTDFGAFKFSIVRRSSSIISLVKTGYAPPEMYSPNGNHGPWSDIYSAAAVMYFAMTGKAPVDASSRLIMAADMPPINKAAHGVPKNAAIAISNALNLNIDKRTHDAGEIVDIFEGRKKAKKKREKIKKQKYNIPLWVKIAAPVMLAVIAAVVVFLIKPDPHISPYTRVPMVEKLSFAQAENILNDNDLNISIVERLYDDLFEEDTVIIQNPEAGMIVLKGTPINVTVSAPSDIVIVRDVVGKDRQAAEAELTALGLRVNQIEVSEEEALDGFAKDTVQSQSIMSGEKVAAGTAIDLYISPGKSMKDVELPNMVGMTYDACLQMAIEQGFLIIVEDEERSDVAPGTILRQTPEAGTMASSVMLTVARSMQVVCVPNVVFYSAAEAEQKLRQMGLACIAVEEESQTVKSGLVLRQEPAANSEITSGATVTIYISKGYSATIPNVVAKSLSEADSMMRAGNIPYTVEYESSNTVPAGYVIRQSPDGGITVPGGTQAVIVVSSGSNQVSVMGISLNSSSETVREGTAFSLIATVMPSNASNTGVNWSSGNAAVAVVSANGTVTALSPGTAVISATTVDGSYTATCLVTVQATSSPTNPTPTTPTNIMPSGVNISESALNLTVGNTYQLGASVTPGNATNPAVMWSSENSSVASVTSSGFVTAQNAGQTRIIATTVNGLTAVCAVTVTAPQPVTMWNNE